MKMVSGVLVVATMVAVMVVLVAANEANCDVNLLLGACEIQLKEGGMPSEKCCDILTKQLPCICGYPERHDWPAISNIIVSYIRFISFKMKMMSGVLVVATMVAVMVVLVAANEANCDVNLLLGACEIQLKEGGMPSEKCCDILTKQLPCICGYPERHDWPGITKTCGFCDVPFPPCP
ncbi:unnamed protein product [Lactuca saligna]|uniref:Bifunctional inhibitor/plant lipid transfer protein/seed storage helical domain-containing protein n=1 Tax=Lactuca saligna TaxID=75948 RepID=A0AA35ZRB6_LACSI|nr:unnamed protein product [Lactuca saligna]